MSYRRDQRRKLRRIRSPIRLSKIGERDARFCDRHGISIDRAHLWNRYPAR